MSEIETMTGIGITEEVIAETASIADMTPTHGQTLPASLTDTDVMTTADEETPVTLLTRGAATITLTLADID